MKTKYYSEKLDKYFDTEEECAAAEKAFDEEQALAQVAATKRAKRFEEVEALGKAVDDANEEALRVVQELAEKVAHARETYFKARKEFIAEYGSYSPEDGQDSEEMPADALVAALVKVLLS